MNKKIYSLVILLLISSLGLVAQTRKKYQKTFSVDKKTSLIFQTNNIDVTFKVWDRDEVKVDFSVDFKNYSEEEIGAISSGIAVEANMKFSRRDAKYLQIQNTSPTSIGRLSYQIKSGEIHVNDIPWPKEKRNRYRSVNDINKEVSNDSKGFDDIEGYVVFKNDSIALKDIKNTNRKEIQSIQGSYVIYVPKYMKLGLSVYKANINFEGTFTSLISAIFLESKVQATELLHKNNVFSFTNGAFKVKKIIGGNFSFKNVTSALIGQIENAVLETEFSKLAIGEITKNVKIKDFKSNFFIYNLGDEFDSILMTCEYSDIKMYIDKTQKHYMEAVGNNAVMNDDGMKIVMQPNRDGKKLKMFTRGETDEKARKNTFKLDLVHGFVTLLYNK
ncbi:hypothetical protein [uncultured Kordia sp.]|uniref:hypothetical protein n=1 Tax=uncultured Kordia sp. TaxID=507699 RepID=UPI00261AF2A7|nr:hypothetical protein [uncultured Kordia sp.]